jgi:hypothetical protein
MVGVFARRIYSGLMAQRFADPSPATANSAEEKARRPDIYDAICAPAGFDAGIAEIFEREKEFEMAGERAADAQISDDDFAELQAVFVVLELAADPANPWREGNPTRSTPRGANAP